MKKERPSVKSDGELKIRLETNPQNQSVDWEVEGDVRRSLTLEKPNEFLYKPSGKPDRTKDAVTLFFYVVNEPKSKEKLVVLVE